MIDNKNILAFPKCIYCLVEKGPFRSVEHPIPESLGCPPNFILQKGIICDVCNNGILSALDKILCDNYDLFLLHQGKKTKKGKNRIVRRPNMIGYIGDDGPVIIVNSGNKDISITEPFKTTLKGLNRENIRNINSGDWLRDGDKVHVSYSYSFNFDKYFKRAIHKIAFEYFAFVNGNKIFSEEFDDCRKYVKNGLGDRSMIVACENTQLQ